MNNNRLNEQKQKHKLETEKGNIVPDSNMDLVVVVVVVRVKCEQRIECGKSRCKKKTLIS